MQGVISIRRWVSAATMGLLLLGTAMPALVRMTCRGGGHTAISVGQAKECCPVEDPSTDSPAFRAVCCEFDRTVPVISTFHAESRLALDAPMALPVVRVIVDALPLRSPEAAHPLPARPPPLLTTERLSRAGAYLI